MRLLPSKRIESAYAGSIARMHAESAVCNAESQNSFSSKSFKKQEED
jgi:hypothetical protein